MKAKTVSFRIEASERKGWGAAARDYKNLSAFLISAVRKVWKWRRLIEEAERIERKYELAHEKTPRLRVMVREGGVSKG